MLTRVIDLITWPRRMLLAWLLQRLLGDNLRPGTTPKKEN